MSSAASEKPNIPMFSLIRDGVTDFGMTTFPSSMCQRRTICAGVLPYLRESAVTTGSARMPLGPADSTPPSRCRAHDRTHAPPPAGRPGAAPPDRRRARSRAGPGGVADAMAGSSTRRSPGHVHSRRSVRTPSTCRGRRPGRCRPVDQVEVRRSRVRAGPGSRRRRGTSIDTLVVVPQLGRDEQLLAWHAAAGDRPAHRGLVAIQRSGVDASVPGFDRGQHCPHGFTLGNPEYAEPDCGIVTPLFNITAGTSANAILLLTAPHGQMADHDQINFSTNRRSAQSSNTP